MLRSYRHLGLGALQILVIIITALAGGILLLSAPLRAADPSEIACPNGQTVILEGDGPPREALLIFLAQRAVGGGISDGAGRFRLPLRANERPGVYPVEVRLRGSGEVVARFSCYIDLPLDANLVTPSPTGAAPPRVALTPSPTAPGQTTTPTLAATGATTTTVTATLMSRARGTPSATTTLMPSARGTPSATPTVNGTATPTATSQVSRPGLVEIVSISLRDSVSPEDRDEFVTLTSTTGSPLNLSGWRLSNTSRTDVPAYIFPTFTLNPSRSIMVFSTSGEDDLESGEFFWGRLGVIWSPGDRAELRDVAGRLVASLDVRDP